MKQEMDAFSIVLQHWVKEENQLKERKWREELKGRQNVACERMLLNRRTIRAFKTIVHTMIEMMEEDMFETEDFNDLFEMASHLAVDVIVNEDVFGVCTKCESGIVRFYVMDNQQDLGAVCTHCGEYHLYLRNIFPEN